MADAATTDDAGRRGARLGLLLLGAVAAVLLFANLGNQYLWQDEAQTALLGGTILSHGVPVGYDGRNHFSQESGAEYGGGYWWRWHTWLSFYLVAASFRLFGADTLPARLPFALCALATVLLAHRVGRALWGDRAAALAGAGMLASSVPFLLLGRQCRWYAPAALFTLLGIDAYVRLGRGERRASLWLVVAAMLLFHTHWLYSATLLATLCLHALLCDRAVLGRVVVLSAAVAVVNLPWILWLARTPYGDVHALRVFDAAAALGVAWQYVRLVGRDVVHPAFLVLPLGLAVWRRARGDALLAARPGTWSHVILVVLLALVTIGALGLLAPDVYFRYLTPIIPPLFVLLGLVVGSLWRVSRVLAVAVVVLWMATGSMRDYLYEITHDFDGPMEGVVQFLREHARPGDTVAMTYGDLPVKFYTGLRVVGGLTGEDLGAAQGAEWIVLRRHAVAPENLRVQGALLGIIESGDYVLHEIEYPDTPFENRESPGQHLFRTARGMPGVRIYEKRRREGEGPPGRNPGGPR